MLWSQMDDDPFCEQNYVYDADENPVYWHPRDQRKRRAIDEKQKGLRKGADYQIFKRSQRRKIKWKGEVYSIGDCIEISKPRDAYSWNTDIAMIEKIYVYDEPDVLPSFSIFWFWRERELRTELSRRGISSEIPNPSLSEGERKYIDHHVYLDIEFKTDPSSPGQDEVQLVDVRHKVMITHSFSDFGDLICSKLPHFGNVFWADLSLNSKHLDSGGSGGVLFEKWQHKPFKAEMQRCITKQIECHKAEGKRHDLAEDERSKNIGIDQVKRYLKHFEAEYSGDDVVPCFELRRSSPKSLKLPLQRNGKLVTNVDDIEGDADDAMDGLSTFSLALDSDRRARRPPPVNVKTENDWNGAAAMRRNNKEPQSNRMARKSTKSPTDGTVTLNTVKSEPKKSTKSTKSRGPDKEPRKSPIKREEVLEKNRRETSEDEMTRMERLCRKMGITKGVHIGVTLYGYSRHVDVYLQLLKMVKMAERERVAVLEGMKCHKMRDIKSKIGSEGQTGRKTEMRAGILKMLKVLDANYRRYQTQKQREKEAQRARQKEERRKAKHRKNGMNGNVSFMVNEQRNERKRRFEQPLHEVPAVPQNKRRKRTFDFKVKEAELRKLPFR